MDYNYASAEFLHPSLNHQTHKCQQEESEQDTWRVQYIAQNKCGCICTDRSVVYTLCHQVPPNKRCCAVRVSNKTFIVLQGYVQIISMPYNWPAKISSMISLRIPVGLLLHITIIHLPVHVTIVYIISHCNKIGTHWELVDKVPAQLLREEVLDVRLPHDLGQLCRVAKCVW